MCTTASDNKLYVLLWTEIPVQNIYEMTYDIIQDMYPTHENEVFISVQRLKSHLLQ